MKIRKSFFLSAVALSLLGSMTTRPIHAVPPSTSTAVQPPLAVDDADINFNSVDIPAKYCHGFKTGQTSGALPAPRDPQVRKRYLQAQELLDKGFAYMTYGRYDKALIRFNAARLLWPDAADNYRWLAEDYEAEGKKQEAIANYRLLFYGWPGKYVPSGKMPPKEVPADKPRDYDQPHPAETDPTLLLRFSLLLQQTQQYAEARTIYNRGMQALTQKLVDQHEPLPSLTSTPLTVPPLMEAETRTALAIDQLSYRDEAEAQENLKQALRLQSDLAAASYYHRQAAK